MNVGTIKICTRFVRTPNESSRGFEGLGFQQVKVMKIIFSLSLSKSLYESYGAFCFVRIDAQTLMFYDVFTFLSCSLSFIVIYIDLEQYMCPVYPSHTSTRTAFKLLISKKNTHVQTTTRRFFRNRPYRLTAG